MRKALDFHERNPKLSTYFKKIKSPDETFFQTLIIFFSKQVNGSGIMYANWSGGYTPHPGDLCACQIQEEFQSQKFYFARKFSTSKPENLEVWRELYRSNKS